MRILLVTPYRRFRGGVESLTRMLQTVFEGDGHEVSYLTAEGAVSRPARLLKRLVGLPAVTAVAYRQIERSGHDLVIANGEFGWGISHPNAVCLFHGSYRGFRDHLRPYLSRRQVLSLSWLAWIQRIAARGKKVVAVSPFIEGILRDQGIRVSRVIENGIDTDRFHPGPFRKPGRYLFVGNYHRYGKGFDILEEISRKGLPVDCVTDVDPGNGLGFLGAVRPDKMPEVYRSYGLLIFPSRFEGLPLAPLEAMSCGLPVVMSNVGAGPEIRKEIPQFVVDADTPDVASAFVERIAWIEGRYEECSNAAREYVLRNHSCRRFADRWRAFVWNCAAC